MAALAKKRIKVTITLTAWIDRDEWAAEYGIPAHLARMDVAEWFADYSNNPNSLANQVIRPVAGQLGVPMPNLAKIVRAKAKVEG